MMPTFTFRRIRRASAARAAAAFIGAFALVAVLASPVLGASPRRLSAQVTDDVGALSGGTATVQPALDGLQGAVNVQLWVWFTETTASMTAPDFATETARLSSFGGNDLLLVIAMTDHAYGYWKSDSIPISNAQIGSILGADLEPALRSGDNAGAIVATAAGIRAASGATIPTATPIGGGSTSGSGSSSTGGSPLGTLVTIVALVGVIAVGGWWFLYGRKRLPGTAGANGGAGASAGPVDEIAAMKTSDLEQLANQSLVQTDDGVRDSEQELGFAQAQFGDDEVAPFQAAIAGAKSDLAAAFKLRQQLDDAIPEDAATHRRMLEALVRGCRHAQGQLDALKDEFERLREIEAKAPQILAALPAQANALEARIPATQAAMARLAAYADGSWQSVAPNIDEARQRLAAVREAIDEGAKAISANDPPTAGHAARLGQDALGQASAFLDGVERLATQLAGAKAKVDQMLVDADRDLAQARQASAGAPDPDLAGRLGQADTLLAGARAALAGPKPDVAAAFAAATNAHSIADDSLVALRTAAEQRTRDAARLDASVKGAQATLTRATDFIATRRGAVGTEARTRLAEAERHLDQAIALGATDPVGGAREADEATRLANAAFQAAQDDYGRYDDPWHGGRRGGGGGGIGGNIAGGIIGGIIGGMLSGGGRGGFGGFGGGGFGGGWGGGSSGGGGFGGFGGGSSGGGRW